jgi:hypothetical protein
LSGEAATAGSPAASTFLFFVIEKLLEYGFELGKEERELGIRSALDATRTRVSVLQ